MRILIATDSFPPACGGSGWSTWELARGLRRRGHTVLVVQPRPGTTPGRRTREVDGFQVIEIGSRAPSVPFLRNYLKNERLWPTVAGVLADVIARNGVEVVHGQHALSAPAAVLAARHTNLPVVCTVRDYWPVCYWSTLLLDERDAALCPACTAGTMTRCVRPRARGSWPAALPLIPYMRANLARKQALLGAADAVLAVSSVIAQDLEARTPGLDPSRVHVIPNPVDVPALASAARGAAPLDREYAIYAGKLAPNKGTDQLVAALAGVSPAYPLLVVGDGPSRGEVEAAARASGRDIRFTGWLPRDETLRAIAHAAFVVFPSRGPESLSRVLLEAGALGVPAAAMDTGGTRDIVRHEETGLLSRSAGQLAADVARLAADAALRARLGAAARAHVETTFDAAAVVQRIEAVYREVIATERRWRHAGA